MMRSTSICDVAATLAKGMNARLPMQIDGQASLNSASSNKQIVTVAGTQNFDRDTARRILEENNISLEQFKNSYAARFRPILCKRGSMPEEFTRSGGVISCTYTHKDGTPFMGFKVNSCE